MDFDLTKLNSGIIDEIVIDQEVCFNSELYDNTEIKDLKDLKITGTIFKDSTNIITLNAVLSGIMVLEDSISLDLVDYQFKCEIDEKIEDYQENLTNLLDITEILWQNIVLEVPLRFTQVENLNEYQGDGWKLISEDSVKSINNPFNELKDLIGEEW